MIKKPRKVLAMALALSMLASAFVGTNAFAAGYVAKPAIEASVKANFYTVDENGVRSEVDNTGNKVATCTFKDKASTTVDPSTGKFYVGERYTLNIEQDNGQANKYKINTGEGKVAKMLVTLNEKEKYVTDLAIVQENTNIYTVSFDAMTSSKIASGVLDKGNIEIAIDVEEQEEQSDYTVKGYEYTPVVNTVATFSPVEGLNDPAKGDVYFKFEKTKNAPSGTEYLVDATKLDVKLYTDKECTTAATTLTKATDYTLTADFTKGVNYYKLSAVANDKTLNKVLSDANVKGIVFDASADSTITQYSKTTTNAEKTITFDANDLNNWNYNDEAIGNEGIKALPGTVVKLKYIGNIDDGKYFNGASAKTTTSGALSVITNQYIDYANKEVSFVMPVTGFSDFKASNFVAGKTLTDNSNGNAVYLVNDKNQAIGKGNKISLSPSLAQTVKFAVSGDKEFFNYLNDAPDISNFTNTGKAAAGWGFIFKGITEENGVKYLNYEVTAGSADATFTDAVFSSYVADKNPEKIYVPVKFDQFIVAGTADAKNANVAISYIGDGVKEADGKISTSKVSTVKVNYTDDVKLKDGCLVNEKGEGKHFDITENNNNSFFVIEGSADNIGKVLSVEASYVNGTVNTKVNPDGAGYINVYDKNLNPLTNARVSAGETVYFQVKANEGYTLKEKDGVSVLAGDTIVELGEEVRFGEKYYSFKMPKGLKEADTYGPSVTVEATFEKDNAPITIKNNTPEADKATNNGYISVNDSVALGETVNMQVLPNDGYVPNEIKVVAKKADQEVKSFDVKQNGSIHWGYSFDVPSDLDADSIEVSATFNQKPEVQDGWNKNADNTWSYIKDGKVVTGWKNDIPGWEGQWFYFDANGIMLTSWQNNIPGWEGQWFYFDVNTGVMATGWQTNIPGWGANWFYFNTSTGTMLENQYTPDGYYVDANGCWVPNK